jgi:hypothetical protein
MSRIIETVVYNFEELSLRAKERARDWWRSSAASDFDSDYIIEDAVEIAKILGIRINDRGNGHAVFFSGFCSQGDGACFEGYYNYASGAAQKIRQHAPNDIVLHAIADGLQQVQRRHFYALQAQMLHRGRYQHSGCMTVDVEDDRDCYRDIAQDTQDEIASLMRDFADWIYRQLEREYDYCMSDECVDDALIANGYEFDETGKIAWAWRRG